MIPRLLATHLQACLGRHSTAEREARGIGQLFGHLQSHGRSFDAYYFRTSDQQEIDLVLDYKGRRWAIEVKLSSVVGDHDLTRLRKTAALLDADRCLIISRSSQRIQGRSVAALNLTASVDLLLAQ